MCLTWVVTIFFLVQPWDALKCNTLTNLLSDYGQDHTIKKTFTLCKCYKHQTTLWLGFNLTCFHSFCKNSTETNSMRSHHNQESLISKYHFLENISLHDFLLTTTNHNHFKFKKNCLADSVWSYFSSQILTLHSFFNRFFSCSNFFPQSYFYSSFHRFGIDCLFF